MPVLFGNTYMLPAIIVVVLVVLLLLVIVLRKRRSSPSVSKTAAKPERRVASPPRPTKASALADAAPIARASPADKAGTAPTIAEPGVTEAGAVKPPATTSAAAAHPDAVRIETVPQADPLHAVIFGILRGWGDIAEEDTKRLALFRPEKVLAAVQAMEALPKELKSSQHARTRLTQLRQYAVNSVDRARKQHEAACEAVSAAAEPVELTEPAVFAADFEAACEAVEQPAPSDFEDVTEPETPLVENDYADELPVYAAFAAPTETRLEMPFETAEAPVVEPIASEISELETPWSQPQPETMPQWQTEGAPAFFDEPESSLSSLHGTVKTADEILALPAAERPDMVAFLEPAELSKVFDRTDDPGLKKAIVDTLEHVSNPASLEVLRRCLDDPDPQIQLYALEAADRLLGVD
jgi:hypothetical protein